MEISLYAYEVIIFIGVSDKRFDKWDKCSKVNYYSWNKKME